MLSLIFGSLLVVGTYSNCYEIDGGAWKLVRHTYNQWHQATDNLDGTETYGTFVDDPESESLFSVQFDAEIAADPDLEFMFSTGDCSEWMIMRHSQFSPPRNGNPFTAQVEKSSNSEESYTATVYNRDSCCPEDPWISIGAHETNSLLYGEASYGGHARWNSDPPGPFFNVFIRDANPSDDGTDCETDSICAVVDGLQSQIDVINDLVSEPSNADLQSQIDVINGQLSDMKGLYSEIAGVISAAAADPPVSEITAADVTASETGMAVWSVSSTQMLIAVLVCLNLCMFVAVACVWSRLSSAANAEKGKHSRYATVRLESESDIEINTD